MATIPLIIAYFAAWSVSDRSYFVTNIPVDNITHINYAFANINSNGSITLGDQYADVEKLFEGDTSNQSLRGNFNQLNKLKQNHSHLRTLISVGGSSWSDRFSDVARNDSSRSKFAASCIEFIQKYGFDGIDLDWEFPVSGGASSNITHPEDTANYILLLKEIRQQLDRTSGEIFLLTVATGAGPEQIANMNLSQMAAYLDWFNVMTYDYHGSWESITGHNAALFKNYNETTADLAPYFFTSNANCNASIQSYIAAGVPREKLVMGMPLYGRGWQGVTGTAQNGFSQPASSQLPPGTWEKGIFDYDDLKINYVPSYSRYWDDQSKVPFLFNQSTTIWISYDDLESIKWKSNYILSQNLAGAMFWEMSSDRQGDLIGATFKIFNICSLIHSRTYAIDDVLTSKDKISQCYQTNTSLLNSKLSIILALCSIINLIFLNKKFVSC